MPAMHTGQARQELGAAAGQPASMAGNDLCAWRPCQRVERDGIGPKAVSKPLGLSPGAGGLAGMGPGIEGGGQAGD